MAKPATLKPFSLDECKVGPSGRVPEVTINRWKGLTISNIVKEEKWTQFISGNAKTWDTKKAAHRGLTGVNKEADATNLNNMLEYIGQYAPGCLYRDITQRSKSLEDVWNHIRAWANLKPNGCNQQAYYEAKFSFTFKYYTCSTVLCCNKCPKRYL